MVVAQVVAQVVILKYMQTNYIFDFLQTITCSILETIYNLTIEITGSFIAFILAFFWYKSIIPEFEKIVYKGVKIGGEWKFIQAEKFADGTKPDVVREIIINIKQKAHRLEGNAKSIKTNEHNEITDVLTYDISGEISDRFVTLNFKSNDQIRVAYSNCLLEVVSMGHVMKGYRNFYGFKKEKICSVYCELIRI